MRRDDHRFAEAQTAPNDLALNDRQFFHRTFDAEIAARDHDCVRCRNHFIDLTDGRLIFNLGHHQRVALFLGQNAAQFFEVALLPRKTQGHEIDIEFNAERNIE